MDQYPLDSHGRRVYNPSQFPLDSRGRRFHNPVTCQQCGANFQDQLSLNNHMVIHSQAKAPPANVAQHSNVWRSFDLNLSPKPEE